MKITNLPKLLKKNKNTKESLKTLSKYYYKDNQIHKYLLCNLKLNSNQILDLFWNIVKITIYLSVDIKIELKTNLIFCISNDI